MGGRSTQQQIQATQTNPWQPAVGQLQSILAGANTVNPQLTGVEQGALAQLSSLGQRGNEFAPAIGNVANILLAGGGPERAGIINNAYQEYLKQLSPITNLTNLDPRNTPGFSDALNAINSDIASQINGQFAAAGRDMSGMNTQALARGLSQGEGQVLANQYNQNVQNYLNATAANFGAGATTTGLLSGLDQTRLANMQAGVGVADIANQAQQYGPLLQLEAEAKRREIPLQALASQLGITLPLASAFSTQTANGSNENQMSGADQFLKIAHGLRNLFGSGQSSAGILAFPTG
jgi:hypothetical protein